MKIEFAVRLPVDSDSVPFVRGLCRQALEHLGVEPGAVGEVVLALTEACSNVVQHAGRRAAYEVAVSIVDGTCRIAVVDDGTGFDAAAVQGSAAADGGQGLLLMRALVDDLDFRRDPDGRHRVVLEKRLPAEPPLRLVDPV